MKRNTTTKTETGKMSKQETTREIAFEAAKDWNTNVLDVTTEADWHDPRIVAVVDYDGKVVSGELTEAEVAQTKKHLERVHSL